MSKVQFISILNYINLFNYFLELSLSIPSSYVYMISYTFHSFFHNAGMFNKDQLFWIIFAYLLAVKNIHKNKLYNLRGKKKYA